MNLKLDNSDKKVGIIGCPVSHSLSPLIHNFWLKKFNINAKYTPIHVENSELEKKLIRIKKNNFLGFNVTIPHKENIIPFLDLLDSNAKNIGAVNTVILNSDGKLIGRNTDGFGFIENLKNVFPNFDPSLGPAAVIGAGGAARSICFSLKDKGCNEIRIISRRKQQAENLAYDLGNCASAYGFKENYKIALKNLTLFVNTSPMGMKGFSWDGIDLELISSNTLIYDIVYKPEETYLIKVAKMQGNNYVTGIGMLLYQAIPCFKWWFGKEPFVDEDLKKIIRKEL